MSETTDDGFYFLEMTGHGDFCLDALPPAFQFNGITYYRTGERYVTATPVHVYWTREQCDEAIKYNWPQAKYIDLSAKAVGVTWAKGNRWRVHK